MKIMNLNNNSGYSFNAKVECQHIIDWIREWFENNGKNWNAVIGISGGKDSTVVAALCKEALGADRVIGVLMPNGIQSDIEDAKAVVNHLGIRSIEINIEKAVNGLMEQISTFVEVSTQTKINLPPRIRMSTLYAISQSYYGRVANTSNLSEKIVSWETRWADSVGDFSPLAKYTATEVVSIGKELGLPIYLVEKIPTDGLCGHTDEESLGVTYQEIDEYIRTGKTNTRAQKIIDKRRIQYSFKSKPIPTYQPNLENCLL